MYKYELHCHTAHTSACGRMSADDIVNLYLANGYDGVVITDHFLNGNTTVHRDYPDAGYEEQIEHFCEGYEEVKVCAKGKLQVFFGFEYSYLGTDVLVYGFDKQQLKKIPEILDMDMRSFCDFCREQGVLAVQAHPFREAGYIDHIRLYPNCEAVEAVNAVGTALSNDLGMYYAKAYQKIITGGSDLHQVRQKMLSGMAFDERVTSIGQLISLLRSGKGSILYEPNQYLHGEN